VTHMHFATDNAAPTGRGTYWLTSTQSIRTGGANLAREIHHLLEDPKFSNVTKLSLVGGSLGGLYARHAARLLFGDRVGQSSEFSLRPQVLPHSFITLASPHLGVTRSSALPPAPLMFRALQAIGSFASTAIAELKQTDGPPCVLDELTDDAHLSTLRLFQHRSSYAPMIDDGIVHHATSAFGLAQPPCPENTAEGIVAIDDTQGVEPQFVTEIGTRLCSIGWEVVHVRLAHKVLATLHRQRPGAALAAGSDSQLGQEVAQHLVHHSLLMAENQ